MGKIRELCRSKNITLEQLSEKLGYIGNTAKNWDNGRGYNPITSCEKIAKILGCSVRELFEPVNRINKSPRKWK